MAFLGVGALADEASEKATVGGDAGHHRDKQLRFGVNSTSRRDDNNTDGKPEGRGEETDGALLTRQ